MSSHFSANQYETAFSPKRLQNYEVPAKHKERPSLRRGKTTIISNNRGHLNSSVRPSTAPPWSSFVGTWQTERKPLNITTKSKLFRNLEQYGRDSKQSTRAFSARSASVRSNRAQIQDNSDAVSPIPGNVQTMELESQLRTEVRSPSNASSRPATVSSIRSSVQGSRTSSPAGSLRSPTPSECSRASSALESVAIASLPSTAEKDVRSPSNKIDSSRPQSPLLSTAAQSRLHTSQNCDTET
ncbi:protein Flattop homolog [Halichondria panicea]|uniref:protein Flattop homolog n=1 Tax=Halichondria panicea TaxID=6063 RepID=UPI00312B5C94